VVTLLGAETEPVRGWQQGAALLDWGFSVPAGAAVGRLVEPGETDPKPSPSHRPVPPAVRSVSAVPVVAVPRSRRQAMSRWTPHNVGSLAVVVVTVPLALGVLLSTLRRNRSKT
jgi:D-alanyl-D-alanine carboxypeptidase (penicillin-binding protein 5/6)